MSPAEITAAVEEIRERVRQRHEKRVAEIPDFELPSLEPLGHARDVADGKAAAIGSVNPRPPGLVNNAIQSVKRTIARALGWFVRDQIDYNYASIRYMDQVIETLQEQNHNLLRVARLLAGTSERTNLVYEQQKWLFRRAEELQQDMGDVLRHWQEWRPDWEERSLSNQIALESAIRDIEAANRTRDEESKADWLKLHGDFRTALNQSVDDVQAKFWADLAQLKAEQERLIHTELRLLRRRQPRSDAADTPLFAAETPAPGSPAPTPSVPVDYARFEERFRGDEKYVRQAQRFYLPYFEGRDDVLDLGCGRGEFLELLRDAGVSAQGADLDEDAVAACGEKGLSVERVDLFGALAARDDASLGGIFCAHVIEHIPVDRLPALVELAMRKLAAGGLVAFETPNPGCLAIYARDFYLDPTHVRPVPRDQMHFYLEEAGMVGIEVHELHPAAEVFPEIARMATDENLRPFQEKFFGGLNYAILAKKPAND